jgi:spore coat polysaccharide biosynthesis predicted glycosyltransferase SpsG
MKIYFRTNYNLEIGIGNLSRINKIFRLLSNYHDCKILIDRYLPNIPFKIKKNSFIELYPNKKKFLSQKNEARIIIKKFKKFRDKKKLIFVDDYRMKYQWEKELSKNKFIIITIDDFINNKHYSDYYINTKLDLIDEKIKKN